MQKTVFPAFVFPGGNLVRNRVFAAIESLCEEKTVDYCICQVYAVHRFGQDYLHRWNACHSFGEKAVSRFLQNRSMYHEDKWLSACGLSRSKLFLQFTGNHPLLKFVFPEYEENTKRRMLNTETGFYICLVSTLLWTPFSPVCNKCHNQEKCREITKQKYPELYCIRIKASGDER